MISLSRRNLVSSLALAPAATALPAMIPAAAQAQAPLQSQASLKPIPPLARFNIGRFQVTILTDGYTDMPYGFFTNRTPEEVEAAAWQLHTARPDGLRLAFNQYLIQDGDQLVLVDTGPAGKIGETGKLPAALEALGVAAEDIDAVIITHTHFDHISGLSAGDRQAFPNAELYVDRRDIAYFTDPAARAAAPEFLHSSFNSTGDMVRLYPSLQQTDGARQIAPGIKLVDLTGHTPGHVGVRIEDGGQSLLLVSDMLFHPSVHPRAADVGFVFEQDPAAALAMRQNFFPQAAEEGALIAASHMPFPGLGHIVRDGGELRWLNAEWAHRG